MLRFNCPAFSYDETIPSRYAGSGCDGGENLSPPLEWLDLPKGTQSLVVMVEDPDAPQGTFTHWVAYDISPDQEMLTEGASGDAEKSGFTQGRNSYGNAGYDGPCPPAGETHRYFFYLYALDIPSLEIGPGATADQVRNQIEGHVLDQAQFIGRYGG